jgi:hypothetical protein
MGNKDSRRREIKKPKKKVPKPAMQRDEHPVSDNRVNKTPNRP